MDPVEAAKLEQRALARCLWRPGQYRRSLRDGSAVAPPDRFVFPHVTQEFVAGLRDEGLDPCVIRREHRAVESECTWGPSQDVLSDDETPSPAKSSYVWLAVALGALAIALASWFLLIRPMIRRKEYSESDSDDYKPLYGGGPIKVANEYAMPTEMPGRVAPSPPGYAHPLPPEKPNRSQSERVVSMNRPSSLASSERIPRAQNSVDPPIRPTAPPEAPNVTPTTEDKLARPKRAPRPPPKPWYETTTPHQQNVTVDVVRDKKKVSRKRDAMTIELT